VRLPLARYRALLSSYLLPQWGKTLLLSALLLTGIGLQLAGPLIIRSFIDLAAAHASLAALLGAAALYLVVAFLTQGVGIAEAYTAEDVAWTATNLLRADVALHCLRLDMSFHTAHTPGELIERIDGDANALANFFARFVVTLLGNALLLVGMLVVLFRINWQVGLALLLYSSLALAALNRMRGVAVPRWRAVRQYMAEMFGFIEERLSGAEDLRANGATAYPLRRLYEWFRSYLHIQRAAFMVTRGLWGVTALLFTLGTIVAFILTAYLYKHGAMTIGTAYLVFAYTQQLVQPLEQISGQLDDFQQASASATRMLDLLDTQPAITDGPGASWPDGALSVEFDRVCFGYQAGRPVLRDLSFSLPPGRVLGVLGRTGSGKSTLTRLLFRLYDPDAGMIRLGGVDLRRPTLDALRARVGLVTQEVQLFQASVRDNLRFYNRAISDEQIMSALHDLGLTSWYAALPRCLDTELAGGGAGLSAGQAQLLALVRAFLTDPNLVILDEASSRLDPATERQIERAMDRLLHGRTAIIVAHRLTTVQRADDILILEDGYISEHGPRAALAGDPHSRFSHLLRTEALTMRGVGEEVRP